LCNEKTLELEQVKGVLGGVSIIETAQLSIAQRENLTLQL
jgi:hypothetical protein